MSTYQHKYEQGGASGAMLAIIGLSVLFLAAGSFAIWAFVNYNDQKTNVDGKINLAVAQAKREQSVIEDAKFAEREKAPNRQFVGPDDYGRVTFDYPKTWSAFESTDIAKGGTYDAYLNPVVVPPLGDRQRFALRISIEEKDYDQVVRSYEELVKKGDLRNTPTSANGHNGTRLDGSFSKDIRGAAVIYKIRDKTLTLRTDAETFKPDFEELIKTVDFNG